MTKSAAARVAAFLLCGCSLPSLALAVEATLDRDEIVVIGTRSRESFTVDSSKGALKIDVPLIKTPQAVQVIPEQIIDLQAATELSDVLRNVSGITDHNSFGGVQDNFNLRGFPTDNGETLRDGSLNIADRALTPNVERVEVLKGPSSLLYGRFSPGGLVNVVTKKPQDELAANLSTRHSTRGQSVQTLDLTGPLADGLAFRLVGEYEDSDPWRTAGHDSESKFFAPSLRWAGADTEVLAQYEYRDNDQGFDRGRVAFNGRVVDLPATRSLGEDFAYNRQKAHNANLQVTRRIGDAWRAEAKASFHRSNGDDLQVRPRALLLDAAGNLTGFYQRSVDGNKQRRVRAYYLSANLVGTVDTGPLRHNVLFGIDQTNVKQSNGYSVDSGPRSDFNIFAPVYGLLDVNLTELTRTPNSNSTNNRRNTGFYLQDLVEIGEQWSVVAGGRYDRFRNYVQSGLARPTDNTRDGTFLPRVGGVYKPLENLSFYASYARSFKPNASIPASAGQPAVGPFPPEKGRGYEVGVKSVLFSGVNVTLAAFDIKKQNVLQSLQDGSGQTVTRASAQVTSKGIELDVAGEITPEISVIATYSYIRARDPQNILGGRKVLNIPAHKATLSASWRPAAVPGLSLGGGVFHLTQRYGGVANTSSRVRLPFTLDAYTTAELYAGYEMPLGEATAYTRLTLRNLTDVKYDQMSNGDLRIDPGLPRTLFATVGVRF